MHDLRAAVYRHLQRLSLAFFTRTRTGEVQSRIANDIGGVQNVVTIDRDLDRLQRDDGARDASSRCSCSTGGWRCSRSRCCRSSCWLTRRVGDRAQARSPPTRQERDGRHLRRSSQESLSRVGHPARQDDGPRRPSWPTASSASPSDLADLEVRSAMAGRWMMAVDPDRPSRSCRRSSTGSPALAAGGAISIGTARRLHDAADAALLPDRSLLGVGVDVQTSLALFDRVFEYLDLPVDIDRGHDATLDAAVARRRAASSDVWFRYGRRTTGRCGTSTSTVARRARRTAIVGETGSGKTTLGYLAARLYDAERGRGPDRRRRRPRPDASPSLADAVGVVSQETYLFHASVRENLRFAKPDATDEEIEEAARAAQIHDADRRAARRLRHRRRRARLPLLRRREAAHRDRAHDPAQPAGARARRGDQRARHRRPSAPSQEALDAARRGPHDDRDRPPPLDRPRRRPDRRARPRRASSSAARTTSCSRSAAATRARRPRRGSHYGLDPAASLAPAGDARTTAGR